MKWVLAWSLGGLGWGVDIWVRGGGGIAASYGVRSAGVPGSGDAGERGLGYVIEGLSTRFRVVYDIAEFVRSRVLVHNSLGTI